VTDRPAGYLLLKFTDERGQPLPRARVHLEYRCENRQGSSSYQLNEQATHYFNVDQKGTYDFTVVVEGRQLLQRQLVLDPAQPMSTETFALAPAAAADEARGTLADVFICRMAKPPRPVSR